MAYNRISNEAFIRASQNGTLDTYEKWVEHLLKIHTILTGNEFVDILVNTYGPDAQYGHIFSGTLATMQTAGKLCTKDKICNSTGKEASGYYINPDYTPAKQDDFEYTHSLTKALPGAVKTFNKRAVAVGQDEVNIIKKSTVKKLKDLEWALQYNNYSSQADAAVDLKAILKEIL